MERERKMSKHMLSPKEFFVNKKNAEELRHEVTTLFIVNMDICEINGVLLTGWSLICLTCSDIIKAKVQCGRMCTLQCILVK